MLDLSLTRRNLYLRLLRNSFNDARVNWEFLKYKIRQKAKKTADTESELRKERRKHLENEVVRLENE